MATQSQMAPISPPDVARAQDTSKSQATDPNTAQETQESDLAWELVKDECHDGRFTSPEYVIFAD
jgi:hypothetical protein